MKTFEQKDITLKNGFSVALVEEEEVYLSLKKEDIEITRVDMPWQNRGYGGGYLSLSPSEQYLVFSYFSGQSEEAFRLYAIHNNRLEEVYMTKYTYGEASSYGFSKDEDILVQAYTYNCCEWWRPIEYDDLKQLKEGLEYLQFGKVNCLDIRKKSLLEHEIGVIIPKGWTPDTAEYNPFLSPKLLKETLVLQMPWGDVILKLPLEKNICLNPFGQEV